MDLVIDQGNSFIKAGFYENGELLKMFRYPADSKLKRLSAYTKQLNIESCLISSVGRYMPWKELIAANTLVFLSKDLKLGLSNIAEIHPETGLDRLTAAGGASLIFPKENILIVDLGTCITYDFVDKDARYTTGNISCGVQTRLNAMHSLTSKLPLLHFEEPKGDDTCHRKSTETCMWGGVMDGVIAELEYVISRYKEKYGEFKIIFTGGDGVIFAKQLKNEIFAETNFVIKCLYKILNLNT